MLNPAGKPFTEHDNYRTPRRVWQDVVRFIPAGSVVWEPFYLDGQSGRDLRELRPDLEVVHENEDFYACDRGTVIVTNPPFSDKIRVLQRLKELDKPFILIMPGAVLVTKYFRELFGGSVQIIVPRKRIEFDKIVDGQVVPPRTKKDGVDVKTKCCFDCYYFCYKMGLERDIVFL